MFRTELPKGGFRDRMNGRYKQFTPIFMSQMGFEALPLQYQAVSVMSSHG
jgi:hypothetical protein